MAWAPIESPAPAFCWQARLTADEPEAGLVSLAFLRDPITLQVEGAYGAGLLEVRLSNSGLGAVPAMVLDREDLLEILPALWVGVRVTGADEETDLLVTVAGRR